ncbi:MAG TPA: ABC transporter substrate-binding protein [Spirochaetia bacterium]|nr:ABC transporter substrate-binding protein [Spirochaetia bacterium]
MLRPTFLIVLLTTLVAGLVMATPQPTEVRLGYFPNITHSQALIGVERGDFAQGLGSDAKLVPTVFNAGPSVIEALFAGKLDLAYIGPSPAVNGFLKSKGQALVIVAGATSGGASLVVRDKLATGVPGSLVGKKLASPQLGNTQDVALRSYLKTNKIEASVVPMDNPLILDAFRRGDVDGAWLPEPWASRLVVEAGAVRAVDERTLWPNGRFPTAVVIVSKTFLKDHADLVRLFLKVHAAITQWEVAHPVEAQTLANQAITTITGKGLSAALLKEAWDKMGLETTFDPKTLDESARDARALGFLKGTIDLTGLVDLSYN